MAVLSWWSDFMETRREETVGNIQHAGASNKWICPKCADEFNNN